MQDLVEQGADINAVNEDGYTALMLAARNGHLETVQALMEVPGIDTNKKNNYGSNAMHYAAMYAHREVVQALDSARKQGDFDDLVVAAAPGFLGDLRALMPDPLRACVRREINKDYTTLEDPDLQRHLAQHL